MPADLGLFLDDPEPKFRAAAPHPGPRRPAADAAAVGVGRRLAAQGLDDVVVVERMTEAVDRGGLVTRLLDLLVVCVPVSELPVLDLVDRHPADPDRSRLTDDRDRS